jgi:hypothetical protein
MAFLKKFFKKSYPTPDTCPICFDNIKNTITTKCNHTFCNSCLQIWLKNNDSCPLCRDILNDRSVIQNENITPLPPPVKFRVIYNHKELAFIGALESITQYNDGSNCYKFINIEQPTYPIGEVVYVFENLATIRQI